MEDNDIMTAIGFLFWAAISTLIGALIGKRRGRPISGVVWGFLLGPLGWIIVALLKDLRPKCPLCGAAFVPGSLRCCHCGGEICSGTIHDYERWKKAKDSVEP